MAGGVDLFAGLNPIAGTNLFKTDKNPLNEIDAGIQDVIGKQAQGSGSQVTNAIQTIVQAILGLDPSGIVTELGQLWPGSYQYLTQFFGDIESFFNIATGIMGTSGFDLPTVIEDFITGNLKPSNLIAMLVTDATQSGGVSGFIPMENLALDLIAGVVGGAQEVIDAIMASVGYPAGSATATQVDQYFKDLMSFLANPLLAPTSGTFDPMTAVGTFITDMIHPQNLLAPMDPASLLLFPINIPGLDATQITSGQFPQSMVQNLTTDLSNLESAIASGDPQAVIDAIVSAMGGPTSGNTATDVNTWLQQIPGVNIASTLLASVIPGLDATKIISGVLATGQIPNITLPMSTDMQTLLDFAVQAMGGTGTAHTLAQYKTALMNIPGVNVVSTLLASVIPGLDATKIISGVLALTSIPNLPAGQITSGTFLASLIPGLDATKIVSGIFPQSMVNITSIAASIVTGVLGAGQIPGLDATKIVSGILALPQIPNLPASIITSGSFPASVIPGLDASKIISGVFTVPLIPPLDASQIQSGMFGQWLLPNIPVGSVGQTTPNLLANPNYASATSVQTNPDWTWDGAVDHDGDGSGSVKCLCTGAEHDLLSDPPTPVAPNQTLNLSHYLTWSGVTGSGACFQLSVVAYNGGVLVNSTVLQTISNPAASGAWQQLSGSYTVPASGVNNVRLELQVLAGATAGTTHWDTGSITKTQLLAESWTAGLPGDLSNLNTAVIARALQTDVMSLVNNLGLGSFSTVGGGLSSITSRLAGLSAGGLFDSSALTNLASHPPLDASKIASGILGIAQIPTSLLGLTNITDLQTLNDHVTNALVGAQNNLLGTTLPQARGSMNSIFANVVNNTQIIQSMQSQAQSTALSGVNIAVDFANYPDGAMPSFFTVTYSGAGTSQIGIKSGLAGWNPAYNDGTRTAFVIYNAGPTNTDYQFIRGSMSAAPGGSNAGGQPYFYALGRVDSASNPRNYVFGRAYCTGFLTYKADLGYCVSGVESVWASGIALTWSTSMAVVVGANSNPRQYQVFSGTQLVYQGTEPGTVSNIGAGFRLFGAKNMICMGSGGPGSGTPSTAGTLAGTSVSDNQPPSVLGSTFKAVRLSTTAVTLNGTGGLPPGFFDTLSYISPDMTWNGQAVTVTVEGTYLVTAQTQVSNIPRSATGNLTAWKNGGQHRTLGGSFGDSYLAQAGNSAGGACLVYLRPGDSVLIGFQWSASGSATGEASGCNTSFEMTLANRSIA